MRSTGCSFQNCQTHSFVSAFTSFLSCNGKNCFTTPDSVKRDISKRNSGQSEPLLRNQTARADSTRLLLISPLTKSNSGGSCIYLVARRNAFPRVGTCAHAPCERAGSLHRIPPSVVAPTRCAPHAPSLHSRMQ